MSAHLPAITLTAALVAGIAGLLYYDHSTSVATAPVTTEAPAPPDAPHQDSRLARAPQTRHVPPTQRATATLTLPADTPPARPSPQIYRCITDGRTVYQAHPCTDPASAVPLEGGTMTVVDPYPVTPTPTPSQTPRARMGGITRSDAATTSERCSELHRSKRRIESEQRAGTTSQRMNTLTTEWHRIVARLRDLGCSKFP